MVLQLQEMEKFHAKVVMLDATIRAVMSHGEHVFLDTRQYRMRHPDFRGADHQAPADRGVRKHALE